MRYAADAPKIPAAAIPYEDAELLADLVGQGKTRLHMTLTPKTLPDAVSYNVIGDLKGSEKPDEIVVVGGHLDSWDLATGATDDASGFAVSMQVAQLVKKLALKPKRTIRVVAFMAEEEGIYGGKAYYEANKANMGKHFAAIESDAGSSHALGFIFSGKEAALPMFEPIAKILQKQGALIVEHSSEEVGGDIDPMRQAGVPQFAPKVDMRTYFRIHHTPADTFDKIDLKELQEQGSVMAVLAYGLANLEVPLPR
jgi:Zn-dependent M28 family amino/carboxypeptidase